MPHPQYEQVAARVDRGWYRRDDELPLSLIYEQHSVATNQMAELRMTVPVRLLRSDSAYFNPDFLRLTEECERDDKYADPVCAYYGRTTEQGISRSLSKRPNKISQISWPRVHMKPAYHCTGHRAGK